jgi:uncharacterized membrane protein
MDFLITLCAIAAGVMAARAFSRTRALAANILVLNAKFEALDQRLSILDGQTGIRAAEVPAPPPVIAPVQATSVPEGMASESPAGASVPNGLAPEPQADLPAEPPSLVPLGKGWEEVLVENWLVWLGGLALALGGAFLVKLSIDYGLLTPAVRVALGTLLGVTLWGVAEWLAWGETADERPSNVCQALAAAGAAAIFASFYAAYQLYGLFSPALAFPLLALVSAATVLLSLQHGPFVAALGLSGAFAVPLLVENQEPAAFPLFAYLTLVTAAALALLRYRQWWWLAWVAITGSIGWALLWLGIAYQPDDVWVIGFYLMVQFALFAALRRGIAGVPFMAGIIREPIVRISVRAAFWAVILAVFVLVQVDGYAAASLSWACAAVLALLVLAYRDSELDDLVGAAGVLAAVLLTCWTLPLPAEEPIRLLHSVPPEQVGRFIPVATGFVVLFGLGGFFAQTRAVRPSRWAILSAAAPPVVLAISYWRLQGFKLDIAWTATALAIAAAEMAAAVQAAQRRDGMVENEIVLAAYAVGVLACTILAAVFALENAWLTVALASHLPALGWVEGRIRLPVLRHLALGMAATVLVRLVFNPEVLNYPLSDTLIFNWLLYGYGLPAAAFVVATRQFGSRADDLLVKVLEAGSVAFSVLLVTLELWHAFGERDLRFVLDNFDLNAMETAAWLAIAGILLYLGERRDRSVLRWSGIIMFGAATVFAVGWQAIVLNPLMPFIGPPVTGWVPFDSLFLAYALPAFLYGLIGMCRLGPPAVWRTAQVAAAGFAFLWVTLEVRHLFHGERLNRGITGEAEWYSYSAAWLAFASGGLAAALKWRNIWLRRVSLLGIGLVVGKVFLSDMADLSGALRALSFIGLGAVLVAIGYAYRRLQPLRPDIQGP